MIGIGFIEVSRILLVEDEEGLSGAIREWLEDEYYVVDVASDGVIGLDRLSNKKYELILLDWMLPGMSGIELCKKYRGFAVLVFSLRKIDSCFV